MSTSGWARLQFGVTITYHFVFVPLTIGLAVLLAILETLYVRHPDARQRQLLDFFGRLFLVNFAVGVVTGIFQEFQFGMAWARYATFVGDVFGAPLAVEALVAFFLESTFLGVWIFGWDRLSPAWHAATMWLVAAGTTLSAFFILAANAFMQEPVGYVVRSGRAEMVRFSALLTNPQLAVEFPHVWFGALATGAFFMTGVSAWQLARRRDPDAFDRTFRLGAITALVSTVLVIVVGHAQAQHLVVAQPMKIAASEALWTTSPARAPWTVVANVNPATRHNTDVVAIPDLLSILAYNRPVGRVPGLAELERAAVRRWGPGNYVPPVLPTFWSFRVMILAGFLMLAAAGWAAYLVVQDRHRGATRFLRVLPWAMGLPYVANIMGWIMTEVGRQPWVVYGLQRTVAGTSPAVGSAELVTTFVTFGVVYLFFAILLAGLMVRLVREGLTPLQEADAAEVARPRRVGP
jgi:cytochrome d ubiquinol oxidase subunit I